MTDSPTKIVLIATSVLITVGLISLAAFEYGRASGTVKTMSNSLLEQSNEWDMSSLASLDGKSIKGSEVASLIRKYKGEYTCKVSLTNGTEPKVYTSVGPFVNSTESSSYIKPESIFKCTLSFQGNSVSVINFDEKSVDANSIVTADDAKAFLSKDTGRVSLSSSWQDISNLIKTSVGTEYTAASELAAALGFKETPQTKELLESATKRIKNLENAVGSNEGVVTESGEENYAEATLDPVNDNNNRDEVVFKPRNTPRFIIAYDVGSSNLQMLSEIVVSDTSSDVGHGETSYAGLGWVNQSGALVNQSSVWCGYKYTAEGNDRTLTINNASHKALQIIVFY